MLQDLFGLFIQNVENHVIFASLKYLRLYIGATRLCELIYEGLTMPHVDLVYVQ